MTRRWLPWLLWGLSLAFVVIGDGLQVLQAGGSGSPGFPGWAAVTLNALAFGTVGALVAYRRPTNAIGWLFLAVGFASAFQLVTAEYATYDRYILRSRLWSVAAAAWVSQATVVMLFAIIPFILLLFPDGRFLSSRWRLIGQLAVLCGLCSVVAVAITPGEMGNTVGIENPVGLQVHGALVTVLNVLSELPLFACLALGVASLVVRWRRSGPGQRQQLKWVMFSAACGFGAIVLATAAVPLVGELPSNVAWTVGPALFPVGAGISVLRYRLYDIDRIVSRTVSYALLTGLLVAGYVGLVTAVTRFTPTSNSLAVAASTLAAAAAFQPLRRRVQSVVDRRFNRARYDAARTVETFSTRLREQLDLDSLRGDLVGVVGRTIQPAWVDVWLRVPNAAER